MLFSFIVIAKPVSLIQMQKAQVALVSSADTHVGRQVGNGLGN